MEFLFKPIQWLPLSMGKTSKPLTFNKVRLDWSFLPLNTHDTATRSHRAPETQRHIMNTEWMDKKKLQFFCFPQTGNIQRQEMDEIGTFTWVPCVKEEHLHPSFSISLSHLIFYSINNTQHIFIYVHKIYDDKNAVWFIHCYIPLYPLI